MSGEQFGAALARLQGVTRLLNNYTSAERISDKQTIEIAKKLADSALVDAVFISGRDLADKSLVPTPQELQTFFEKFKSFKPGEGEFGIGYKLPPRVMVEWITIDRPAIEAAIDIALPDAIKYYKQNTERFPGDFDSQRSAVEAELRKAKADSVVSTIESVIRADVALAIRPLEKKGDYRILPADWDQKKTDFLKIADAIPAAVQEAEGITISRPPVYIRSNSWLDEQRLRALPGIGTAQVRIGQTRGTFAQFVLSVRELAGDSILNLQVGIPNITSPAVDEKGSEYFFTVLAAAPSEVANEYTQVLDQDRLLSNWRAMQRYEQLVKKMPDYLELAQNEGLDVLAASFGTIDDDKTNTDATPDEDADADEGAASQESDSGKAQEGETSAGADTDDASQADDESADAEDGSETQEDTTKETPKKEPVARVTVIHNASVFENRTNGLMRVESNPDVIDAVRRKASKIDPLTPLEDIPLADRMVSVAVPARLGVLIAQINGVQPLTREQLPRYADSALAYRQSQTIDRRGLPYAYQFEALRARHGFESLRSKDDKEDKSKPVVVPSAPAPAQDTPPASKDETTPASETGR